MEAKLGFFPNMRTLVQDLKYAVRSARKRNERLQETRKFLTLRSNPSLPRVE